MERIIFFGWLLGIVMLHGGCSSIMQFQDAAPLGKGTAEIMGGFGAGYYPTTLEKNNYGFPLLVGFRYGVGHRTDLGVKYTIDDDVELNLKHNLVLTNVFLLSTGLHVGVDGIFGSDKNFYGRIPLYIQLRLGSVSVYGIPSVSTGRFNSDLGLAGNLGVSFGRYQDKVFIEAGVGDFEGIGTAIKTFGVGFAHRF
ncbi:MAG TPA: hypothetical protein VKZ56_10700 [Membranihabitans sp.]|nr:hypothetical protein [Membranihabitans sp.]